MTSTREWDYLIVGGGLAGCVVAHRLKQYRPSSHILVIEAGPDVSGNEDILRFSSLDFVGGQFDWGYKTVPQKHLDGREIDVPSGRALGGGSVINGCGWFRGSKADFDSWAEIVQDERWSYKGQLPYFKMTEKWYNTDNLELHGQDGKLQIESPISTGRIYPLSAVTEQSWIEAGTLDKYGIEIKVESPEVGNNFNDHVMVHLNWKLKDPTQGYAFGSNNPLLTQPQFAKGTPLSHVACTTIPRGELEAAIAKDEGHVNPDHYMLKRDWALMENLVMYLAVPPLTIDGTHISNALMGMKPTSRGTVTITSKDPKDAPLLDPNYLATEVDKVVWRHSLRKITALMTGDTALGRDVVSGESPIPGFKPLSIDASDEYLDKRVKAQGRSTYHGCGTCAMGKVVDTDLRVKGVQNLRIVDASVLPISIGAHIQAAVYALAEQATVIISQD